MYNINEEEQTELFESVTSIVQLSDPVWSAVNSSSLFNSLCKSNLLNGNCAKQEIKLPSSSCNALIVLPKPPAFDLSALSSSLSPIQLLTAPLPPPSMTNKAEALVPYSPVRAPPTEAAPFSDVSSGALIQQPSASKPPSPLYPIIQKLNRDLYQQYMALRVIYLCNSVRELQRSVHRNISSAKQKLYSALIVSRISSLYTTYATLHAGSTVPRNHTGVPALTEWDIDDLLRKLRSDMRLKRRAPSPFTAQDVEHEYKTAIAEVQAWRNAVEECGENAHAATAC